MYLAHPGMMKWWLESNYTNHKRQILMLQENAHRVGQVLTEARQVELQSLVKNWLHNVLHMHIGLIADGKHNLHKSWETPRIATRIQDKVTWKGYWMYL